MPYATIPSRFLDAVDRYPLPQAVNIRSDTKWEEISSGELLRRAAGLSSALVELGVKPGDRVGVFAANRPEWHIADFAISGAGGVNVPIYFNESPERMAYILNHSGAKVVFVAGDVQSRRLLEARTKLIAAPHIIVGDSGGCSVPEDCLRYETLIQPAGDADIAAYRVRASQVMPGQLASIIYTSGTTGEPKGVMLSHSNFCSNVEDSCAGFDLRPGADVALSFLPLAHVYGRIMDYIHIFYGVHLYYVPDLERVAQALVEVRPTIIAAVPRFFEKIYARVMEEGSKTTGLRRKVFDFAVALAPRAAEWRMTGRGAGLGLRLRWWLADKLVYSKIRARTGGRLRIVSSGGAPIAKDLAEFFWAVGVPIYQGYGLTETSPIVTTNYPVNRIGSVGKTIPHVEVRVAEDGEILVKGPCVMQGYYNNAGATREVLRDDGWLATGDIGYVDKDGYLFITDRKKDLIKTAAGKFVAPQPIEGKLKTSPYILNAMIVGDRRKFVVALIVPNFETVRARAVQENRSFSSDAELASDPWVHSLIDKEIQRLTTNLASFETIKRFTLLPQDFTFLNGGLTYTLKLKRRVVEQQYCAEIDELYADVAEARAVPDE